MATGRARLVAVRSQRREEAVSGRCRLDNLRLLFDLDISLPLRLRRDDFGGAVDDLAVDGGPLDHPVARAMACYAKIDARRAEIKVPIVASRTMVMDIRHGLVAAVAADGETMGVPSAEPLGSRDMRSDRSAGGRLMAHALGFVAGTYRRA